MSNERPTELAFLSSGLGSAISTFELVRNFSFSLINLDTFACFNNCACSKNSELLLGLRLAGIDDDQSLAGQSLGACELLTASLCDPRCRSCVVGFLVRRALVATHALYELHTALLRVGTPYPRRTWFCLLGLVLPAPQTRTGDLERLAFFRLITTSI